MSGWATATVLVLTSVDGGAAAQLDRRVRAEQEVTLHAAVRVGYGRRAKCDLYTDAPRVKRTVCRVRPLPEDATVTWYKIESAKAVYDNATSGTFHWDEIDYVRSRWTTGASVKADLRPVVRRGVDGVGTMRFLAEVRRGGGPALASTMPETRPGGPRGRGRDARKVSARPDDTYLGYMQELAGLPYIFGSAGRPHQADARIGVDCADLMIYGLRRRCRKPMRYRGSRTLGPISTRVVPKITERRGGVYQSQGRAVVIGPQGLRPGDWLVFDGHVGALYADRGTPGVLDAADLILHIVLEELAIEPLSDSGYGRRPFEVRRAKALAHGCGS